MQRQDSSPVTSESRGYPMMREEHPYPDEWEENGSQVTQEAEFPPCPQLLSIFLGPTPAPATREKRMPRLISGFVSVMLGVDKGRRREPRNCDVVPCLSNWIRAQVIFKFRTWFRGSGGCPLLLGVRCAGREAWRWLYGVGVWGTPPRPENPRCRALWGTAALQRGCGRVRLPVLGESRGDVFPPVTSQDPL